MSTSEAELYLHWVGKRFAGAWHWWMLHKQHGFWPWGEPAKEWTGPDSPEARFGHAMTAETIDDLPEEEGELAPDDPRRTVYRRDERAAPIAFRAALPLAELGRPSPSNSPLGDCGARVLDRLPRAKLSGLRTTPATAGISPAHAAARALARQDADAADRALRALAEAAAPGSASWAVPPPRSRRARLRSRPPRPRRRGGRARAGLLRRGRLARRRRLLAGRLRGRAPAPAAALGGRRGGPPRRGHRSPAGGRAALGGVGPGAARARLPGARPRGSAARAAWHLREGKKWLARSPHGAVARQRLWRELDALEQRALRPASE